MSTTADAIESEYPVDDTQFRDGVIESVRPSGGGDAPDPARGWVISMVDSWSFYVPPESPVVPTKGMRVRLYGRGRGYTVRGLFLDGRGVFYRTAEEQEEADRKWLDDREKQQRYDFDTKGRAALDMKFAALPPVFQARITRFRRGSPGFRWESEGYEMFCCEQAVVIADALKTPDAVDAWRALPWDEQVKAVPIDDGHSGNTFGFACALAKAYLAEKRVTAPAPE